MPLSVLILASFARMEPSESSDAGGAMARDVQGSRPEDP